MRDQINATLLPMHFCLDSGVFECTVEPKSISDFERVFQVNEKDQFRAYIGLKSDVLIALAGHCQGWSEQQKERFTGAFFVNSDISNHSVGLAVPISSAAFIRENASKLMHGELRISLQAWLSDWKAEDSIAPYRLVEKIIHFRVDAQ